ncbi:MAG: glycoside hydrolase family 2, partial [Chitinophagaceae bacterium]
MKKLVSFKGKLLLVIASVSVIFLSFVVSDEGSVKRDSTGLLPSNVKALSELQNTFINIPDSIQTSVYWYWVSDNISEQGVIKDLEAMKKVGINRAFIGNVFFAEDPRGKVRLFSEEWWKIIHTALKTATKLNIEIGLFNSPGWSQSGGPWVKPEQSMRYLSTTQLNVKGPMFFDQVIKAPDSNFQDVKTIAYQVGADYHLDINSLKPSVKTNGTANNPAILNDKDDSTFVTVKAKDSLVVDYTLSSLYTANSLVIKPGKSTFKLEGYLQAKEGQGFRTIKSFKIDRSNDALNVGWDPYAEGVISVPSSSSKAFRIVLRPVSGKLTVAEISISSTPKLEDYVEKTGAKMWQDPFPYWQAYQWNKQPALKDLKGVIDPKKVIDISNYISADGKLKWKVPAGNWVVERTGMVPTRVTNSPASPEGTGFEADKMSIKHIESHFDAYLGQIIKRIPAEDRKTWNVAVQDSYETGGQNWSDLFLQEFKTAYGYDPVPYIPTMHGKIVGSPDISDRFLWDVRRLVADNIAYKYVAGLRGISNKHGLKTWLENYGHWGYPGEFLMYGGQSDEVGGEFWSEGDLGNIENKAASSCAHIYGKTKVSAESFTCAGALFSRYPALMKQRGDKFFTEGINNTLLHVYIQQPYEDMTPGVNAWFGNEFNRKNTWYYDMDVFLQYIKRCNMMLQQGKYVADIAYFISEDAPKMTGTTDPALPLGYAFDYINAEVIKTRTTVKDGRLVLQDGMNYKILVLPQLETMRPEFLQKVKELVIEGAVVLGPKPLRSPSLQNYGKADKQLLELTKQLWGNIDGRSVKTNKLGKGMVIDGMDLKEALDLVKVRPDFIAAKTDSVLYIHRKIDENSIYFLSNQAEKEQSFNAEFRVNGKRPELWNPVTGSVTPLEG